MGNHIGLLLLLLNPHEFIAFCQNPFDMIPSRSHDKKKKSSSSIVLDKVKVSSLQLRLQYAKLKVERGWLNHNLNEVEDLYFSHSNPRSSYGSQFQVSQQNPSSSSQTHAKVPNSSSTESPATDSSASETTGSHSQAPRLPSSSADTPEKSRTSHKANVRTDVRVIAPASQRPKSTTSATAPTLTYEPNDQPADLAAASALTSHSSSQPATTPKDPMPAYPASVSSPTGSTFPSSPQLSISSALTSSGPLLTYDSFWSTHTIAKKPVAAQIPAASTFPGKSSSEYRSFESGTTAYPNPFGPGKGRSFIAPYRSGLINVALPGAAGTAIPNSYSPPIFKIPLAAAGIYPVGTSHSGHIESVGARPLA
ncbi:hypothetical protein D9757_003027 [Collybiopsis confluens]|uniref:Uncharacterized protein n=1 Tax=Collybiopsis confluens TaxID=2823264 RepID=A0A8H5HXG2_9AGAR|nr:hypothetical protein D9757_003027 [Collybiopsis confluens]